MSLAEMLKCYSSCTSDTKVHLIPDTFFFYSSNILMGEFHFYQNNIFNTKSLLSLKYLTFGYFFTTLQNCTRGQY